MNVKELRQRIFDQMDYFPDLQQYRDSVVRRMNDRYQELCDSAHWLFLQKEQDFQIRKEVAGFQDTATPSNDIKIQVSPTNLRELVATGFVPSVEMLGQTFTDNATGDEFTIVGIQGARFYINANTSITTATDYYNWKITFNTFLLPEDCIEVLGYVDRDADRGKLLFVSSRREEYAYLDFDQQGDPSVVVEDDHILDDPPFKELVEGKSTSLAPAGNNLLGNNVYEYKYTIYREGRESPPSLPLQVTTAATTPSVVLENFDNTGWFSAPPAVTQSKSGIIKLVYRRDVTNDGRWFLIGSLDSTTTTFTDEKLQPTDSFRYQNSTAFQYTQQFEFKRFHEPGPRQTVRFWFTPSLDKKVSIRYHFRPNDLVTETDAPILPRQYHQILVYMTLYDMFMQMQDTTQAQLFERRAQQFMTQLRRRYLTRDDEKKRMMRWDRPRRFKNVYGPPTIAN